jgi:uncharacterized protein YaaW (UPF0174 family)
MGLSIEEVLNSGTEEECRTLAEILDCGSCSPDDLLKTFIKRSLNIFQQVAGTTRTYEEILAMTADKHGIRRRLFETDRDLERRLIRSVSHKVLSAMSSEQREKYRREMNGRSLVPQAVGAGGIVLAQASGFGIYQMASTVVGALTATAGLKLPFLAYMVMSKAISVAIGPIGWLGLGVGVLHTLTKPNFERLVSAVACVQMIRQRLNPVWEWRGYSMTEIMRKSFKLAFLLLGAIWLFRAC